MRGDEAIAGLDIIIIISACNITHSMTNCLYFHFIYLASGTIHIEMKPNEVYGVGSVVY